MNCKSPASRYTRIITFSFLLFSYSVYGQDRCGTVEYNKVLKGSEDISHFENWLGRYKNANRKAQNKRQKAGPYTVPVVVHIIHNGENIGEDANISDEQILSQIKVLNDDFKRLNADAVNTPAEFASIAGAMDIEFVLAKQDPEGLVTNGIVRTNGGRDSWTSNDNYQLKSKSYWPSEDYLNVWVCNITDFLGYTQFPVSGLPGLENSSNNAETDGIVVSYLAFGSSDDGAFELEPDYNKGRTLTHEVGHFFGLRHIWGDGNCATDYVDDTPFQNSSTTDCPTEPRPSCDDPDRPHKMFQNYLDYTDDECMNLFTEEQVERMSFVIESSPRRASLLTSPGSQEPTPLPNDVGARAVISPGNISCSNTVVPVLEVRNYGGNIASSVRLTLTVNEVLIEEKDFNLGSLGFLDVAEVTFAPALLTPGTNVLTFQVTHTNGVSDSNPNNNYLSATVNVPESIAIPFSENFDALSSGWTIQNPDQQITWQLKNVPDNSTNQTLYVNFYDYEDKFGEVDVLLSPVFDLSSESTASVSFHVAYKQFEGSNDRLRVVVLKNCEVLENGTVIYEEAGSSLATVSPFDPPSSQSFSPLENQWRKVSVSLTEFAGESYVQLAFVAINDYGNNLYLDNISLNTAPVDDLVLTRLDEPGPVTCNPTAPKIMVANAGTTLVENFIIRYSVNGTAPQDLVVTDLDFGSDTLSFNLPVVSFKPGVNNLHVNLVLPNGKNDATPPDNEREFTIVVNDASDIIPLRETFDEPYVDRWITVNSRNPGGMTWQSVATNFGNSVFFNAFNNTIIGDEAWLVSPVLDFSSTSTASLVFDASYMKRVGREPETLTLLFSTDCGNTYSKLSDISLLEFSNEEASWLPDTTRDWRQNIAINLDTLAGTENVRLAFVAINANGNNLYLDNIELFVTEIPPGTPAGSYVVYGYDEKFILKSDLQLSFNLDKRQTVYFSIVDSMGKQHLDGTLENVLNQTYSLPVSALATGVYIVRLRIGDHYHAEKILVAR